MRPVAPVSAEARKWSAQRRARLQQLQAVVGAHLVRKRGVHVLEKAFELENFENSQWYGIFDGFGCVEKFRKFNTRECLGRFDNLAL